MCVIAGPSGSGKTSLAYDVLAAESIYRLHLIDSLSKRRSNLSIPQPKVDGIDNLPPIIANKKEQRINSYDSIASYLSLDNNLYGLAKGPEARVCPYCSGQIESLTPELVATLIDNQFSEAMIAITADLLFESENSKPKEQLLGLLELGKKGFYRCIINEVETDLCAITEELLRKGLRLSVIIDRIKIGDDKDRLIQSIKDAFAIQNNGISVYCLPPNNDQPAHQYPATPCCSKCGHRSFVLRKKLFNFRLDQDKTESFRKPSLFSGLNLIPIELRKDFFSIKIGNWSLGQMLDNELNTLLVQSEDITSTSTQPDDLEPIVFLLKCLCQAGLGHLKLNRSISSLSFGELNRLRLIRQLACNLRNVGIVIDEPSLGLHHDDISGLITLLQNLRDLGNTVLIVDHNDLLQAAADQLIVMGPGSGIAGGTIVSQASPPHTNYFKNTISLKRELSDNYTRYLKAAADEATSNDLTGQKLVSLDSHRIELTGASMNNLKSVNLEIPLEKLVSIAGVSGSGKSSLILNSLAPALTLALKQDHSLTPEQLMEFRLTSFSLGGEVLKCRTGHNATTNINSWSTVASYCALYPLLGKLFADLKLSRIRGYTNSTFFLSPQKKHAEGLCQICRGIGSLTINMDQVRAATVTCPRCLGKRFKTEYLAVKYKGYSISDLLDMTAIEALNILKPIPQCSKILNRLCDFGLQYLVLGQQTKTLSHGELQRLSLIRSISRLQRGVVYIFDEPTSGLDCNQVIDLVKIFKNLVKLGNTIIAIEHNPIFLYESDHMIELGPGPGERGGNIIYSGSPLKAIKLAKTPTANALHDYIKAQ